MTPLCYWRWKLPVIDNDTDHKHFSPSSYEVNDTTNVAGSPGELLSRRCVSLMKSALRPDMWPRAELKLQWFDKLLMTVVRWHMLSAWFLIVLVLSNGYCCAFAFYFPRSFVCRPVMTFVWILHWILTTLKFLSYCLYFFNIESKICIWACQRLFF